MKTTLKIVATIAVVVVMYLAFRPSYPYEKEFYTALENFTYIEDAPGAETYTAFTDISQPFFGDCEDFAFTLQKQIGGEVWAMTHTDQVAHAVLIVEGIVYDNFFQIPTPVEDYPGKKLYPIFFRGEYINNS